MSRKVIAISLVMLLCISSFAVLMVDESSDAETTGVLRAYTQEKIRYSTNSIMFTAADYEYVHTYHNTYVDKNFNQYYYYYGEDPSANILQFLDGKAELKPYLTLEDLQADTEYWAMMSSRSGYGDSDWDWKEASMSLSGLFLPRGKYTIEFTATEKMKDTISNLRSETPYYRSPDIEDGKGTITVEVSVPMTLFLNTNKNGGIQSDMDPFYWKVGYKISPSIPEQRAVECTETRTITTNAYWSLYETVDSFESGTYRCSTSSYAMFVKGSAEETDFVNNVVNKGLTTIPPSSDRAVLTSESKIDVYKLKTVDSYDSDRNSLHIYKEGTGMGRDYPCIVTDFKDDPFTFYAGQSFSVAVSYDTSKYSYVILKSAQCMIYLESGKVYDMKMGNASEYQLYGVIKNETVPISSFEVGYYTENISTPDDNGMIFAVVAIAFCAIAFFMLFFFGRRPKWDDSAGLPETGSVETVVNEVSEEVPEAPAEEASPEQPPEE